MAVVDASDRMLTSINGGKQKWQAAIRSLQDKISILPGGANFGLVAFGQVGLQLPVPCSEAAQVLVPVNNPKLANGLKTESHQQRTLSAAVGINAW